MAKHFELGIDEYQASSFTQAVRSKRDVIVLWMHAMKSFLAGVDAVGSLRRATLSIVIGSMSRLFCEIEGGKKIFSISFPFTTRDEDGEIAFYSREGVRIDNRVSSQVLALVQSSQILETLDFSAFIDPIIEASDVDSEIWALLRELMVAEDAYLRYDWDQQRADGHRHPEHHIDVYYTSANSFKVGLRDAASKKLLVEILDADVDCHYLLPSASLAK